LRVKINKCRRQTFSADYSQEFVIYNETVIDISLIVAYHHKFHHQNKKNSRISSAGMFVFVGINHWRDVYFLEGSKDFFTLFMLAAAKSALTILTVKCNFF